MTRLLATPAAASPPRWTSRSHPYPVGLHHLPPHSTSHLAPVEQYGEEGQVWQWSKEQQARLARPGPSPAAGTLTLGTSAASAGAGAAVPAATFGSGARPTIRQKGQPVHFGDAHARSRAATLQYPLHTAGGGGGGDAMQWPNSRSSIAMSER